MSAFPTLTNDVNKHLDSGLAWKISTECGKLAQRIASCAQTGKSMHKMNQNPKQTPPLHLQPLPVQTTHQYIHPASNDEISLVDLWIILAKRKWSILVCSLLLALLGGLAAGLSSTKVTYVTSVKIGSISPDTHLEPTSNAVAKLKELYIPLSQQVSSQGVGIDVKSPAGSNIILLETVTTEDQKTLVVSKHKEVINILLNDHTETYTAHTNSIKNEIANIEIALQALSPTSSSNTALHMQESRLRHDLSKNKQRLADAKESKVLSETIPMKEGSRSIPVFTIVGLVLGLVAGVFLAFFMEFLAKVASVKKERLGI